MVDNFLSQTYQSAMAEYAREAAEAEGDLLRAQADGDAWSAGEATRRMSDIRIRAQAYDQMAREHAASLRPRDPRTDVDLTPEEAMRVAGLDPTNANDVATYNRGWHRLQRLKSQGMYRE